MRSTIFRQYDSRWGSLGYPASPYTLSGSGCGCCACAHLVIEMDKYKSYTPKDFRKYMVEQGFATKGNGTTWDGMTKTLQHYGYSPKKPDVSSSMNAAWTELNKGNRAGIILFRSGSKGGVTWTTGGHYVAFLKYKVKSGKHYFYMKDSGARKHDGWYCYETTMKGLIRQMWIVTLPTSTTTTTKKTTTTKTTTTKKTTTSGSTTKSSKPSYTVGKTYTTQVEVNVRKGAGDKLCESRLFRTYR